MPIILIIFILSGCTSTKKEPPLYLCYAYDLPGIVSWGDTPKQAEEAMQQVNCDLSYHLTCNQRKCDKVELF